MAKIINLIVDGDYEALTFIDTFGERPSVDVYNSIKETGEWEDRYGEIHSASTEERDISLDNFEYAISLIDYDNAKHERPFLVDED